MKMVRFVVIVFVATLVSVSAWAQDGSGSGKEPSGSGAGGQAIENEEFGVTITPPPKWEVAQGDDKAVANFKHRGSQSQIEVVGTKLMTPEVADVFFKTFHKTLKESNFQQATQEDVSIGETQGTQTTYTFEHSGVTLNVVIFQFLKENTAWLVVGYMQDAEKDKYKEDFDAVVKNMTFEKS